MFNFECMYVCIYYLHTFNYNVNYFHVCMYLYVCMFVLTYMYVCASMPMSLHMRLHVLACASACVYVCAYLNVCRKIWYIKKERKLGIWQTPQTRYLYHYIKEREKKSEESRKIKKQAWPGNDASWLSRCVYWM